LLARDQALARARLRQLLVRPQYSASDWLVEGGLTWRARSAIYLGRFLVFNAGATLTIKEWLGSLCGSRKSTVSSEHPFRALLLSHRHHNPVQTALTGTVLRYATTRCHALETKVCWSKQAHWLPERVGILSWLACFRLSRTRLRLHSSVYRLARRWSKSMELVLGTGAGDGAYALVSPTIFCRPQMTTEDYCSVLAAGSICSVLYYH
jgi:hypothetical protein